MNILSFYVYTQQQIFLTMSNILQDKLEQDLFFRACAIYQEFYMFQKLEFQNLAFPLNLFMDKKRYEIIHYAAAICLIGRP